MHDERAKCRERGQPQETDMGMPDQDPEKRKYFLDKAREAEKSAASTDDPASKLHWLKIAAGYRTLGLPYHSDATTHH